jgi:phage-related minor tail protein
MTITQNYQKSYLRFNININYLKVSIMKKSIRRFFQRGSALVATLVLIANQIMAQSSAGIDQATAEVSSYVDPVSNLIIAIGAVVGLIGGVRVYIKWQSGDQDTQKAIMGWFGACLFLILVGVVIKSFFA